MLKRQTETDPFDTARLTPANMSSAERSTIRAAAVPVSTTAQRSGYVGPKKKPCAENSALSSASVVVPLSSVLLQTPPPLPPHTSPPSFSSASSSPPSSSFLRSFLFSWIPPFFDSARGHQDPTYANTRFNARRPTKKDFAGRYSAIPASDPTTPFQEKDSFQHSIDSEKTNSHSTSSRKHKRVSFAVSVDSALFTTVTEATTTTPTAEANSIASRSMFTRQGPLGDDEPLLPLVSQPGMKDADDLDMSIGSSTSSGTASSTSSTSTAVGASSSASPTPLKDGDDFGLGLGLENVVATSVSPVMGGLHERRPSISLSVCSSAHSDEDDVPTAEAIREANRDKRRLKLAIVLCTTFFCVELAGGIIADSLALLSDSFHLLTDITSFCISLAAIYLSQRLPTASHTFGYHRAEVLGALFSIFLIWGLTCLLVIEAYDRIRHPINIDGKTMSIVAALGVFVNICLMFVLGGHHHHHGDDDDHHHHHRHGHEEEGTHTHGNATHHNHHHGRGRSCHADEHAMGPVSKCGSQDENEGMLGHDHNHEDDEDDEDDALRVAQPHKNLNITAATLHVLGDLLSSIGVLISSLLITFFPEWTILDPICTFVFSFLVILTTIGVFKRSVAILMERVPSHLSVEETREAIRAIPGILEVKRIHLWSLTVGQTALTARVYLQPDIQGAVQAAKVIRATRRMLRQQYGVRQSTIQIEVLREMSSQGSSKQLQRSYEEGEEEVSGQGHSHHPHQSHGHGHGHAHHHHHHSSDGRAPERHDADIIFSVGDDDDDDNPVHHAP